MLQFRKWFVMMQVVALLILFATGTITAQTNREFCGKSSYLSYSPADISNVSEESGALSAIPSGSAPVSTVHAQTAYEDTCDQQYPGDVDDDGIIDVSDITYLVDYLNDLGPAPPVSANADVDGDCIICAEDMYYLAAYLHQGGPPPVECTCVDPAFCCDWQYPGDVDNDGIINVSDVTYLVDFLTASGTPPPVMPNADVNGDCCIGQEDIDYLATYLHENGPPPVNCTCMDQPLCCDLQYPGDVDNDGIINVSDITYLVDYLTGCGPAPPVKANADVNGDCCIGQDDIDYLAAHLHQGGPPPVDCTCMAQPLCGTCCLPPFRGDINYDQTPNSPDIADMVYLVSYMFQGGPEPPCLDEADVDGKNQGPNISDLVYLVDFMFNDGPNPVPCQL